MSSNVCIIYANLKYIRLGKTCQKRVKFKNFLGLEAAIVQYGHPPAASHPIQRRHDGHFGPAPGKGF